MLKNILKTVITNIITFEARMVLRKYHPQIIAVTGSVGKTSTKDAIYAAIAPHFFVRKSQKSFNSEIGVPLTILGCPNAWNSVFGWIGNITDGFLLIFWRHAYPKILIIEVGADRPGDIKKITSWLKPDMVIVTKFAPVPVHVEFFGSPKKVIEEKSELVKALKENGLLILSSDDEDVLSLKSLVRRKTITFGFGSGADIRGTNEAIEYEKSGNYDKPIGQLFRVDAGGNSVPVSVKNSIGRHVTYSVLAAFAVGMNLGLNMVKLSHALSSYSTPNGRMRLIDGIKGSVIIDDSYNSSPVAAKEALETLGAIQSGGKKIAVLGDMMELGKYSVEEHRSIGNLTSITANLMATVGIRARDIAEGALEAGMDERKILQYEKSEEAGKELERFISQGDIILIKGSQSVRMEKTVEEVMAHPEEKDKLLVRQEKQWQKR